MNLLVGDLGGTKTILAIATDEPGKPLLHEKSFASAHYDSLEAMIGDYLSGLDLRIEGACLAVAGPISKGQASITNLNWFVNAENLRAAFNLSAVLLINDLEAVAYAIPILELQDVFTLSAGNPAPGGNIAVLAPGTGLGEAYITTEDGRYTAHASEGSHASFAPVNDLQMKLLTYLWGKGYEHISFERVCSGGLGIPNLYSFLKDTSVAEEPTWLAEKLAASEDPTPVIMAAALDQNQPCELCAAVLDLFLAILGAEAGNQALKIMATGGIYLGGGIPPRILGKLQEPAFLEALCAKGRFQKLLGDIPVKVILNSQAGLLGAAAFGLEHLPTRVSQH